MKITMLTFGTRGDVQPLVALGKTLRARGHTIVIGTAPSFRGLVEDAALDFQPVEPPPGMREDLFEQPKMNAAIRKGPSFVRTVRSVTPPTDDEIVRMFDGMRQACEGADLMITAPVTHIAGFVEPRTPWCSVSWIPANTTREFPAYQARPRPWGWGVQPAHPPVLRDVPVDVDVLDGQQVPGATRNPVAARPVPVR
ncbi:glycosyltransferase [Kibdelosporangium aridum]|uniref:glycosyltransferase n=1 Tax=Kibdelosporangium aridum TaxID=2030 RepID=UPI0035ED1C30